ncbi:ribosome biogenesis GTPase [Mycoplasmoides fastidiosum]|uniref:Ribosome biogenesis GTPase n=1 Tax=Mycoplasmoides fastidiosum TaxID=92758 RepID=A0ABU0LZF5_9BACT|nr:ribosome small subunit-dependent GTPase A [Mycoplasmoides fastidiosum]MDQ0514067.1 ribosome biogenesis GTPase [Mycoplasmoides fastidiosum]UUD37522.1 ribosome small subunit-dependent GTPase A [Mycoplasmoides fastidiosum]
MQEKLQVYQHFNKKVITKINGIFTEVMIPTNFGSKIICGDWIECELKNDSYLITKLLDRKNLLIRPKVANIDHIILVYPLIRTKKFSDLLWWILMYQSQHFNVKVVFSKSDLLPVGERDVKINLINDYLKILQVESFDYHNSEQLNQLLKSLQNKLIVLAGYSGAGKSTFINFLDPNLMILTQSLNNKNLGKHTTTTAKIYEINQIKIIDAPGFSNLDLNLSPLEIANGWNLFTELGTNCKFNDCLHIDSNADCGIISAIAANKLDEKIYEVYLSFMKKK